LNFTKAADDFYTSQPTISRQIALLEDELGFSLFTRDKGNLRLTAGGAIMAQELSRSNQIIRDAIARVELVSDGLEGEISIGFVNGMNTDLYVYPPTARFTEEYPAIKVTVESMSFSGLRSKLATGELDVVFTFDFENPAINNALFMKCYTVSTIIAMSGSHPLASKEDLVPKDFSGQTFLLPRSLESQRGHNDVQEALKQFGVEQVKLKNMNGIESMLFGVRSGIGVALVDTSMELIIDKRYKYMKLPEGTEHSTLDIYAIWKIENLNPIMPLYVETLRGYLENTDT
jgi:DNA-binding transcriptional LysR family regulator